MLLRHPGIWRQAVTLFQLDDQPVGVPAFDNFRHRRQQLRLTLGGNNIFDSYPDKIDVANRFVGGRVAYQSISPAGAEGAFYYVKADYRF